MGSATSVRYRLTLEDYAAFNRFVLRRKKWTYIRNVFGPPVALGLVFFLIFLSEWGSYAVAVPAGVAVGLLFLAAGAALYRYQSLRSAQTHFEDSGGGGERELEVSPRGIQGMTPPDDGFHAWEAVALAVLTPAHLFVLLAPTLAYIVPRGALPPEALEQVRAALPSSRFVETRA